MQTSQNYRHFFKGKNFMTPNILDYYKIDNKDIYVELSYGDSINDKTFFGVTFSNGSELLHDYNESFHSKAEAVAYIETMNKKLKEVK